MNGSTWLSHVFTHPTEFLQDFLKLLSRYHPREKSLNSQERRLKLAIHWAIPPPLRQALEQTLLTKTEFSGSYFNCSTIEGITYCLAFPEDALFGAVNNSFFRCTSSCIANLEYE